jgi:GntR family transcriptional regulator of vanillate catabolism
MFPPESRSATQSQRVVLALREMLLKGDFRAGQRLTELGLVDRLRASRTPVRHALTRLAHEGLLEPLSAGGFRVRAFTLDEIWDAIDLRGVLEGTAARLSAERLVNASELNELRRLTAVMDALMPMTLGSFVRYVELNDDFHFELRRLSKSAILLRTMDVVLALPFASPGALVFGAIEAAAADRISHVALEHHHSIIEAIERREGTRAEYLAREHARVARHNLERAVADRTLLRHVPGGSLIKIAAGA